MTVCGDFGFVFIDPVVENQFLDFLVNKPYTICYGGCVHKIRDNIFHLMRGYVFTINGEKIFAVGGAYSLDKYTRKEGYSWWKEELPTNTEYPEAVKNLEKCSKQVNHIITHSNSKI